MTHPVKIAGSLFYALLPLIFTACTRNLVTPPGRFAEMQSPRSLPRGEAKYDLAYGVESGVFQTAMFHCALGAHRGLGRGLEAGLELNATRFDKQDVKADYSPWMAALNASAKYNPPGCERFLGLLLDLGAGTSVAGQFLSTQAGFSLGYDNGYFAPYFGLKVMSNLPFNTSPVNLGSDTDGEDIPDAERDPPVFDEAGYTIGYKGFLGIKLPLGDSGLDPPLIPRLAIELNSASLQDGGDELPFLGLFMGLEFPLGRMLF